jgi:hypothetical protein
MKTLIVFLAFLGCSNPPQESSSIVGDWIYTSPYGDSGIALALLEGDTFAWENLALAGQVNVEVHKGYYSTIGSHQLSLDRTISSCPGDSRSTWTFGFSQNDNESMTLTNSSGVIAFARNHYNPLDQALVIFGCFDSSGNFTSSPLATLP